MTAPYRPQPVSVSGGAGGLVADCAEIAATGRSFGAVAGQALQATFAMHGYLFDPALALSAVLDPAGYANFEADLLDALDGLHGLGWVGARAGVLDGELRLAASAYAAADQLCGRISDEARGAAALPAALASAGAALVHTGSPIAAAQAALAHDPAAADTVIDALQLPGLLHAAALALPDGHGVARALGADTSAPAGTPPRRLSDVVAELGVRDEDPHHGAVDVRVMHLPDGSRRVIVDVTGTKSWTPLPTADVTSLTTDGRALFGAPTAYEQGVLSAMRQAGVRRTDPVMIVGHSEGGLVAVDAARDASQSGEFTITHVVTAGSPVGRTVGTLPSHVNVLALENARDVVPHLDGEANPDEPNITTVTGARGNGTVLDDHGIDSSYLPLAEDAERSRATSIRAFLHSARDYFRGSSVRTHTFQITRVY